jgi:DNA polymerase I-like protein with 3'-5' exonuclease and polymerase domains
MYFTDRNYTGYLKDEYFSNQINGCIITDYPDKDDCYAKGLLNGRSSRRLWAALKRTSFNTNALYKTSLSLNLSLDQKGLETIHLVLKDAYEKGCRSFLMLGEKVFETIFPDLNESFFKIRGSYLTHEDYEGAVFLTTYHPRDILTKRYQTGDGQANLGLVFQMDVNKFFKASLDGFSLPLENFNITPTFNEVKDFILKNMALNKHFAMDIETTSLNRYWGEVVMIGLAVDSENALCIPFYNDNHKMYWKPTEKFEVNQLLNHLLTNGKHMWMNGLFDVPFLMEKGYKVDVSHISHDIMLLHHAISPELHHDLGFITSLYGKTPYWKNEFLSSKFKILDRDQLRTRIYNLRDCVVIHQSLDGLLEDLKDNSQEPAYAENMMNLKGAIEQMQTGVVLHKDRMKKLRLKLQNKLILLEDYLYKLGNLPSEFNLNSGEHIAYFLFDIEPPSFSRLKEMERDLTPFTETLYTCKNKGHKLYLKEGESPLNQTCKWCGCKEFVKTSEVKLKYKKKPLNNKGEPSNYYLKYQALLNLKTKTRPIIIGKFYGKRNKDTNAILINKEAREALHGRIIEEISLIDSYKRPTMQHIINRRKLRKLSLWIRFYNLYQKYQKNISTYTAYVPQNDNRIHCNILLHGTASGRPASRNPNLLNIPKKYKDVRFMFGCAPEYKIVSFDYSNIEAKMLAYITGDLKFIEAVDSGNLHDINTRTLFNIDKNHPQWALARRGAKIFQFGYISYGGSPKTIWEKVCIEAPGLNLSLNQFKKAGERYFNFYDRFREWREEVAQQALKDRLSISPFGRIRFLHGSDYQRVKQAFNHPPQSGAAHVMNTAMFQCLEKRDALKLDAKLQIQIYDDLRFECAEEQVPDLVKAVVPIMEQPFIINEVERHFPTDLEIGDDWGSLQPVDKGVYL